MGLPGLGRPWARIRRVGSIDPIVSATEAMPAPTVAGDCDFGAGCLERQEGERPLGATGAPLRRRGSAWARIHVRERACQLHGGSLAQPSIDPGVDGFNGDFNGIGHLRSQQSGTRSPARRVTASPASVCVDGQDRYGPINDNKTAN